MDMFEQRFAITIEIVCDVLFDGHCEVLNIHL